MMKKGDAEAIRALPAATYKKFPDSLMPYLNHAPAANATAASLN
jgi:hypothetical protein